LEVGPRDVKENKVIAVRRDIKKKEPLAIAGLAESLPPLLADIQKSLFDQARAFLRENTRFVQDYEEFKTTIEAKRGFLKAFWCGAQACEDKVKEETMATIRVIPLDQEAGKPRGRCLSCGREAETIVYFARSY
jgi:prolyl-tRNA synthetase